MCYARKIQRDGAMLLRARPLKEVEELWKPVFAEMDERLPADSQQSREAAPPSQRFKELLRQADGDARGEASRYMQRKAEARHRLGTGV